MTTAAENYVLKWQYEIMTPKYEFTKNQKQGYSQQIQK